MNIDEDYFNSQDFQELLESYEASIHTGDYPFMDVEDFVDLADYYNWKGKEKQAGSIIDYALQLYPHATLPNVFKARQALMRNDFKTARHFCNNIENRDDPDYHYLQAEIFIAEGHIDKAEAYLESYTQQIQADEYEDFIKDCANLYVDYGYSEKAHEWLMRSTGDDSDDFKELMARTLFSLGKYKDSERIFNELIDRDPYSKTYWNALANSQFMNEEYNDAITSSEYAIAIDPNDPEGLFSKANGLFRLNNFEEALKYFGRYAQIVPDDELCMLYQAVCLINMGCQNEALQYLLHAIEVTTSDSPHLVTIYQELAYCYSALHQLEKAMQALDMAEEKTEDPMELLVIRGHLLLENEHIQEAEKVFRQAIKQSGSAPSVLLRIIVSLYDNHYLESCYDMFKKFFQYIKSCNETFHEGYAYMALCCYDLGKEAEFLEYLKLAVQHAPHETHIVLGFMFPEGMEVGEYVKYIEQRIGKS